MPGIVCAIRGGPDSQPTINKSIQLALETDLPLYFLYVVNLDFLSHTSVSRTNFVSKEMQQMGDFILLTAQSRAADQGVSAESVVRHGKVGEEIIELCRELNADYTVLGLPRGQAEGNIFTSERLEKFIEWIKKESGAEVVLVEGRQDD